MKIQHFIASEDVPADGTIVSLACPGKSKVISGDYATNGAVVADWFAAASKKAWEFAFVDLAPPGGIASVGITCAKGVK